MNSLTPINPEAWGPQRARHLLNRAGFGLPAERWNHLAGMPPEEAVREMAEFSPTPPPATPDFILSPIERRDLRKMHPGLDEPQFQLIYQERQREERNAVAQLQAWWMRQMFTAAHPLEEKMTLFWHGHFATSAQKVRESYYNHQLYQVFRTHAMGNVKALTIAVGQSPAMLEYLDNRKSTREKPNENWARELMELFTLGQGQYTEADIKESARAFTGWTSERMSFKYTLGKHDTGEKSFLGQTGTFDGWDIIDIIFEQPATAKFIAGKLWAFFAGDVVDDAVVEALAQTLRDHDYEVRPMLAQLFSCEAFYSDRVMGSQIKSPVQFALQLCHDLGVEPPFGQLPRATRALGQDLFYPPNVKGWDGNRAWINANSLLIRYNLPSILLNPGGVNDGNDEPMMMGATLPQARARDIADKPGASAMAVSKADRQAYIRDVREQAKEKLATLPRPERQEKMRILRDGTPAERQALHAALDIAPPPWRKSGPESLFEQLTFATAGECIDQLAVRFLSPQLGTAQRAALLEVTGVATEADALSANDLDEKQRIALLRLITSMAEYQLC